LRVARGSTDSSINNFMGNNQNVNG